MVTHTAYRVTNSGSAPRGIFGRDGMQHVSPGETRTLFLSAQVADEEAAIDGLAVVEVKPERGAKAPAD